MKIIAQQPHSLIEMFAPRALYDCSDSDSFLVIVSLTLLYRKILYHHYFPIFLHVRSSRFLLDYFHRFYPTPSNYSYLRRIIPILFSINYIAKYVFFLTMIGQQTFDKKKRKNEDYVYYIIFEKSQFMVFIPLNVFCGLRTSISHSVVSTLRSLAIYEGIARRCR